MQLKTCPDCGGDTIISYRFVDYYNESNDVICNTLDEAKQIMHARVEDDRELRCSIYRDEWCEHCQEVAEEGIIFNEKCPEYS